MKRIAYGWFLLLWWPLLGRAQDTIRYVPTLNNGAAIGLGYSAYLNMSDVTRPGITIKPKKAVNLKFAPDLLFSYTWRHRWRLETGYNLGLTAGMVAEAIDEIGKEVIYSMPIERIPLRLERHFRPGNNRWSFYPQVGLTYAYIGKNNQGSYRKRSSLIAQNKPDFGTVHVELRDLNRYNMLCYELGGGVNYQLTKNLSWSVGVRYVNTFGSRYAGQLKMQWDDYGVLQPPIVAKTRLEGVTAAVAVRYRVWHNRHQDDLFALRRIRQPRPLGADTARTGFGVQASGLLLIIPSYQSRVHPVPGPWTYQGVRWQRSWLGEALVTYTTRRGWRWAAGYAGGYGLAVQLRDDEFSGLRGTARFYTHRVPVRVARLWRPWRGKPLVVAPFVGVSGVVVPSATRNGADITQQEGNPAVVDPNSLVGQAQAGDGGQLIADPLGQIRIGSGFALIGDFGLNLLWTRDRWDAGLTVRRAEAITTEAGAKLTYRYTHNGAPQPVLLSESGISSWMFGPVLHYKL